jgi:putative intracellular protease/amidase
MPLEHRILALVFHEFEALDLFGPLGAIVPRSDYYTLDLVTLHNLPSPRGLESTIKNGIGIVPTLSITDALQDIEPFDSLFIPGGLGMIPLLDDPMLLKKIGKLVDRARTVFTVCTGSLILAATGRLNGREATCNKRIYDEITPKCTYRKITYHGHRGNTKDI